MYKIKALNKTLLIIGLVWPEPNSSAAGSRMMQLIHLFLEQEWKIVFASAAQENEISFPLEKLGIVKQSILLNDASFDAFVASLQPDLVLFDRFITEEQFGWRVAENCPNAIRILDTEDLHCLRHARHKALQKNIPFTWEDLLTEEIAKREIASIYRTDVTLIISTIELQIAKEVFSIKDEQLFYLPLFATQKNTVKWYEERKDFVFIGNFLHEPNWDAVLYLKKEIWPILRKSLPEAKMQVFGAYTTAKVTQLHNPKEGFYIHGRADSAQEVIENARVLIAPLRFGAGIKGKLLEAMEVGTPSVTTSIGAEGMSTKEIWSGFIANTPEDIAAAAVTLYTDEEIWQKSQKIGYEIIQQDFAYSLFQKKWEELLKNLMQDISSIRKQNFIGNLLQQHQYNSTRFLSKWIEEKNKKQPKN